MEIFEIAQLVTGIATLIVASVLIWQMTLQRKTLEIAHQDADQNISMAAMDTRSRTNEWFAENCTAEMLEKFDKGIDSLNVKETLILRTYYRSTMRVLSTEWRLGRLIEQPWYYKNTFNQELMFKYKAFRELFAEFAGQQNRNMGGLYTGLMEIGREALEEAEGKKLDA
ncbi:MAG: hypothetical protein VX868_00465 [Chloroflexota bacterium]|jgi:hypothetical protein|nr:hypothetical protein [Chloroflexota bacterium]|tara:strand:- start:6229 stop:6735 length:507 start_codon:yes stop_codon:yes gene_type:complete